MASYHKKPASLDNPHIAAVAGELLRLPSEAHAQKRIEGLKSSFIVSRHHPETAHSLMMWIKGYALTEEEIAKGYVGNYAAVGYRKMDDGAFTLFAVKVASELKFHPQRKYAARGGHPNWGHPLLRAIKKGRIFITLDEARDALEQLHREYPDASIPGENKLYLMIFSRAEAGEKPVKKYIFEIKSTEEGAYVIPFRLNTHKPKNPEAADPEKPLGRFTAKMALKRKK